MMEMNTQKVSIIVPVYNVEKYLDSCIESLVNQSYPLLQIILVDDGSTDGSGAICDHWATKDNRITVIHKENEGISATRNIGLCNASGDYILFVDSDDWIELDMVRCLVENGEGIDVVACGASSYSSDGQMVHQDKTSEQYYSSNEEIQIAYIDGIIKNLFYGPVAKLYKFQAIRSTGFDTDLRVAEDIVFNLSVLKNARTVKVIPYLGYNIRLHDNSTTHKMALKYTRLYEHDYVTIKDAIYKAKKEWLVEHKLYLIEDYKRTCLMRYFNEMSNLFRIGNPYCREERYKKVRTIHSDKSFINNVTSNNFHGLGRAEQISWILAKIDCPIISYVFFYCWLNRKGRRLS